MGRGVCLDFLQWNGMPEQSRFERINLPHARYLIRSLNIYIKSDVTQIPVRRSTSVGANDLYFYARTAGLNQVRACACSKNIMFTQVKFSPLWNTDRVEADGYAFEGEKSM